MLVVSEEKSFMVMASTPVEKDGWLQATRLCMRDLSANVAARERVSSGGNNSSNKQVTKRTEKNEKNGTVFNGPPKHWCR